MNTQLIKNWVEGQKKGKEKLAAGAEISLTLVNRIINRGHMPHYKTLKKIAQLIGTSIEELVGEDAA